MTIASFAIRPQTVTVPMGAEMPLVGYADMPYIDIDPTLVANRLKALIKINHISNTAFASAAGVSRTTLQNALSGDRLLRVTDAGKIAYRFNVTLDWIFYGHDHTLTVPMRRAVNEALEQLD